jgi:hypothetical protein
MKSLYLIVATVFLSFVILANSEPVTSQSKALNILQELRTIKAHNEEALKRQRETLEQLSKIGDDAREARIFAARSTKG